MTDNEHPTLTYLRQEWPAVHDWERRTDFEGTADWRWRGWDDQANFRRYVLSDGDHFVTVPVAEDGGLTEAEIWQLAEEAFERRVGRRP